MNDYVHRTLRYTDAKGELRQINELELIGWTGPVVVLGEPGMGKTCLLRRIARESGRTFRSAASFVAHPDPASLVKDGNRLVIDGLDELSAAQESDPVYRVLGQLIKADCPPFILSCRAADWRGAIARQDISEEYGVEPHVVTLDPFSRENAVEFLGPTLGHERAEELVVYLEEKSIPDLYGNPLTLRLFAEVAAEKTNLPETRAELILRACQIMWNERNDRHEKSPLSNMDRDSALEAAGAASAALILTGSEAITLRPSSINLVRTLPAAGLQRLPGGKEVRTIVGSRLFNRIPEAEDQFKPIHRSIGEFLGARWIAASVKDDLTRDRVLAMMTIDGGVPASLRGIHAWLAQDARFAADIIATDPYGVLRYGDADGFTVEQGRLLLHALKALQETNPYFRAEDWGHHPAKGLTHLELLEDVRAILLAADTTYHLRTLLLEVIRGSGLAEALEVELRRIMLNDGGSFGFAERDDAAQAIVALGKVDLDWPAVVERLNQTGDENSTRLALGLMDALGFEQFGTDLIASSILAHLGLLKDINADEAEHRTIGTLSVVVRHLSDVQVTGVLEALASYLPAGDPDKDYWRRRELADTISRLVARQLKIAPPTPLNLLKWLRITPARHGYSEQDRSEITNFIQRADNVRRAIQQHAICVEREYDNVWTRIWRLSNLNNALAPDAGDVIYLLGLLGAKSSPSDDDVEIWRELTAFARRIPDRAGEILDAARPFAARKSALEKHLAEMAKPLPPPDWEVEREKRRRRDERNREKAWARHRKDFAENIAALRAGELQWSLPVSQAYLGLFHDTNRDLPPPERIGEWLGPEVQAAALAGFEALLTRSDLPTLKQIVEGYAESRRWNLIYPMIAGVVERVATGRGLGGVPIDVVIAVRIALHNEHLDDRIGEENLIEQLDTYLRQDPTLFERYIRLLIEPPLERQVTHIMGLYGFVRSVADKELARRLAVEWLKRFDDMPAGVESEFIDVLADAGEFSLLQEIGRQRAARGYSNDQHRRNWVAVELFADFAAASAKIGTVGSNESDLLWHLRHRLGGGRSEERPIQDTAPKVLGWIVRQFRRLWPNVQRPSGITSGDTNAWDASEFLRHLINRLAIDTSAEASNELATLIDEPQDGYTTALLFAADTQRRARRESSFSGVTLERLKDVLESESPRTSDDLLAVVRYVLKRLQSELRGNDTDSVVKYWRDDGNPREEDRCTDALIDDLQRLLPPYGISRTPQADMPKGKIVDILYTVGDAGLPIECKGQWNSKLWSAASDQLDALYLPDWRSQDRGIYLVYWFGPDVDAKYRIKPSPDGAPPPTAPDELRERLVESIPPSRRGSIVVEVLDLTR